MDTLNTEEMNKTIKEQKDLAKEVLETLSIADPSAILAGGAVRDWRFGNSAKDLDFYFRLPNHYSVLLQKTFLQDLGVVSIKELLPSDSEYQHMNEILKVFEGEYKGQLCNFMVMRENTTMWWTGFSNSLCECFMVKSGVCSYSKSFEDSLVSKVIKVKQGYTLDNPHIQKMKLKFPDYKLNINSGGESNDFPW